jgi:hypothetical protein
MSLRLPGTLSRQNSVEPSRVAMLTHVPDMPILLQQHQDYYERAVPRLSPTVR